MYTFFVFTDYRPNPSIGMGSSEPPQNLAPIVSDVSAFIGLKQQTGKVIIILKIPKKVRQKRKEISIFFVRHEIII